jgi:hypothetical protein
MPFYTPIATILGRVLSKIGIPGTVFASSLISDTEETLRAVAGLPEDTQRRIALEVMGELLAAMAAIEKTPGPSSPKRDDLIRNQGKRAQKRRHAALAQGAKSEADPAWATAALIEGWLMVNTGRMGRDAFDRVSDLTFGWARSLLTDAELEKLAAEAEAKAEAEARS